MGRPAAPAGGVTRTPPSDASGSPHVDELPRMSRPPFTGSSLHGDVLDGVTRSDTFAVPVCVPFAGYQRMPRCLAACTASALVCVPRVWFAPFRCLRTVFSEINSASPISLLIVPFSAKTSTSLSRRVSPAERAASTKPSPLSEASSARMPASANTSASPAASARLSGSAASRRTASARAETTADCRSTRSSRASARRRSSSATFLSRSSRRSSLSPPMAIASYGPPLPLRLPRTSRLCGS